jgi:hypothetical protein
MLFMLISHKHDSFEGVLFFSVTVTAGLQCPALGCSDSRFTEYNRKKKK